jgi:hypothetical protein
MGKHEGKHEPKHDERRKGPFAHRPEHSRHENGDLNRELNRLGGEEQQKIPGIPDKNGR